MMVVDTNVVSEAMSVAPDARVLAWFSAQYLPDLFTTSITLAEIFYGIELLPAGKRRRGLLVAAETMFARFFGGRILTFDNHSARAFAPIAAARRQQGRPITLFDAQIAAIAATHHAVLATRNTADFEGFGLGLVNPWAAS
jgi:toxin FitB